MKRLEYVILKFATPFKYLICLASVLIIFRSITRGISDYDSYRTAGILITNEIRGIDSRLAYDPSWGTFGSRSGNGPIWNLFLSPFQLIPFTPAVILVRTIVIAVALALVVFFIKKFKLDHQILIGVCFILLLFPFRFLFNTSQGASIAFSIGTLVILLSIREKINWHHYVLIGFASVLCLNYKPHLFLPLIVWYLANRKFRILFSILISGLFCELLLVIYAPNSTQIAWGRYLIARSEAIDANSEFELKYTPFAFFYQLLNLSTFLIYVISFIFLCFFYFYFLRLKFNFQTGAFAMSIGVFIGPYSPTHDQLMIALLYGVIFLKQHKINETKPLMFIPLILWIFPSEFSFSKFAILFLIYNMVLIFNSNIISLVYFNLILICISIICYRFLYTDVVYQISSLGAFFAIMIIVKFQYFNLQIKNL